MTDAQIHIKNYIPIRGDRSSRKGGGTILYVHKNIPISREHIFDDTICQATFCVLETISTIIMNVYRPPKATLNSFSTLLQHAQEFLDENLKNKHYDINIMGDFNFPNIDWVSSTCTPSQGREQYESGEAFLSFIDHNMLIQVVDKPTRNGNILDLFLTNNDRIIRSIDVHKTKLSDHDLVSVNLLYNCLSDISPNNLPSFEEDSFRSLNLHKTNFTSVNDILADVDWDDMSDLCHDDDADGNSFIELLRLTVLQVCAICSPKKLRDTVPNKAKTEHSRKRYILNRKRRKLNAQLQALKSCNPSSLKIKQLEDQISLLHFDIKDSHNAENLHQEKLAVSKVVTNPKFFFSYAKRFSKLKSNIGPLYNSDSLTNNPSEMADILQKQYQSVFSNPAKQEKKLPDSTDSSSKSSIADIEFSQEDIQNAIDEIDRDAATTENDIPALVLKECKSTLSYPICLIWKKSFDSGIVPSNMKIQSINPIFKKGDKSDPSNYRPISLTSHLIKIFERVIRKRLVSHLEANNLLSKNQHGFRKGRSCLTHLLKHIDDVIHSIVNGNEHDVIYLDFAKAFDKVDHEILLQKLKQCGITGKLFSWIKQFLTNRKQFVTIQGIHSFLAFVISGVPQGSVLGPILFLIYIDDLKNCLKSSSASSFADDTRLGKQISCCEDTTLLQDDLDSVVKWAEHNNMALHENKFELLTYRTPRSRLLEELPFTSEWLEYSTPSGQVILPSKRVKDLGVYLTNDLSWSVQVNESVRSANKMANWVLSVFADRSENVMLTLFKSLVRSRLEYSCPVWNPSLTGDIKKLESTQRAFTRHISGCQGLSYWERLKKLRLMSLQRRRERYIIIHVWKTLQGLVPNDLDIVSYKHIRLGTRCRIPPMHKTASTLAKSIYDKSFAVMGPKLWNIIPQSISSAPSLESFKSRLTSYIRSYYPDLPPVPGYTTPNSNSLLDWNAGGLRQVV